MLLIWWDKVEDYQASFTRLSFLSLVSFHFKTYLLSFPCESIFVLVSVHFQHPFLFTFLGLRFLFFETFALVFFGTHFTIKACIHT